MNHQSSCTTPLHNIFVSPNGSDSKGNGTIENPYATLEKAKKEVSSLKNNNARVNVIFREGTYPISSTLEFTGESDSGSDKDYICYSAYENEDVTFSCGKKLDHSLVKKVIDESILSRIIDPIAREKLMEIDLSDQGVNIPDLVEYGHDIRDRYPDFEVYINGSPLKKARWPKEDAFERDGGWLRIGFYVHSTNDKLFTMSYHDQTASAINEYKGRAAFWSYAADPMLCGFAGNDFTCAVRRIAGLGEGFGTNKYFPTVTAFTPWECYEPISGGRIYFFNLLEEISEPGEYYIDRKTKKVYFYPPTDLSDAEIIVPICPIDNLNVTRPMLCLSDVSNITFKNIKFKFVQDTAIVMNHTNKITFDNIVIAHTSHLGMEINHSTEFTLKNSHIYDTGAGAISIEGGDRRNLIESKNRIYNNRIHHFDRIKYDYAPAIRINGCGIKISHNKLYDNAHIMIWIEDANEVDIEYNELYHAVQQASDIGAIYWGRNPSVMGIRIRYNYFHDIGNTFGGLGHYGVFWDAGANGPYLFGNIFYRATVTEDNGGETTTCFPIKDNGGQFGVIKNNIIVDAPTSTLLYIWSNSGKAERYILYMMNRYTPTTDDNWGKLVREVDFESKAWTDKYRDNTDDSKDPWANQWKDLYKYLKKSNYNYLEETYGKVSGSTREGAITAIDGDNSPLDQWANSVAPPCIPGEMEGSSTNRFEDNVCIKIGNKGATTNGRYNGCAVASRNYITSADFPTIPDGFFVSDSIDALKRPKAKDFKLTPAGFSMVRKTSTEFININHEIDKIGLQINQDTDMFPGGCEPVASNVTVKGDIHKLGDKLIVSYTYTSLDHVTEGWSKISWYMSDKPEGAFVQIKGQHDRELTITHAYNEKYIKCEVIPYNCNMIYGEAIMSLQSFYIYVDTRPDLSSLNEAVSLARMLINVSEFGSNSGQYPITAKKELEYSLSKIEENKVGLKSQNEVEDQINHLENSVNQLLKQINMKEYMLDDILSSEANWIRTNKKHQLGTMIIKNNSLRLCGSKGKRGISLVFYLGKTFKNEALKFKLCIHDFNTVGIFAMFWRQRQTDDMPYTVDVMNDGGYGILIKKPGNSLSHNVIELQSFKPDAFLSDHLNNPGKILNKDIIEAGKEYILTVCSCDTGVGFVRHVVKINDTIIFDLLQTPKDITIPKFDVDGYLSFASINGADFSILPVN